MWHTSINKQQTKQLESIQRRAMRIIFRNVSYAEAIVTAGIQTLADRRETLADRRETLADRRETLVDRRETLADRRETLADRRETLADRRETLCRTLFTNIQQPFTSCIIFCLQSRNLHTQPLLYHMDFTTGNIPNHNFILLSSTIYL